MLGGCCPDTRSNRLSTRGGDARSLRIGEPGTSNGRPSRDHASVGPRRPATGASQPSSPTPSRRSFCILSPGFHPLAHASGQAFLAQRSPDVPVGNGFPLDLAKRPRCVHPTRRHGQWLGLGIHTSKASPQSRSDPLVYATPQTSFLDGHKTSFYRLYSDTVAVSDRGSRCCPDFVGLLQDTPYSGKMVSTCPLALGLFA